MSVWNAILQASHSSLIDTLNEAFPLDVLELGLPKRFDSWGTTEGPDCFFFQEVMAGEGTGIIALAIRWEDARIGSEIYERMMARTEEEFRFRKIEASLGQRIQEAPSLRMTIWLPIRVMEKTAFRIFDLGVGVSFPEE